MKVKCPVAKCDYTVKGADDGSKHWQKYDEFHKTLHWNWLKYFFPEIAKSDMPDTVKFRLAYKKWHEDQIGGILNGDKRKISRIKDRQAGI